MLNALPFQRGTTYRGTAGTIDTSDYGESAYLEGEKAETIAYDYSGTTGILTKLAGASTQVCRIVRNVSGIDLKPKRLVVWQTGKFNQRVDGYPAVSFQGEVAGVVDPALGSTVVRNGDLFWLVQQGPTTCRMGETTGFGTNITEYEPVYAGTAATSLNVTAGGVEGSGAAGGTIGVWNLTADITGGIAFMQSHYQVGVALSAKTTANTGGVAGTTGEILVDLKIY